MEREAGKPSELNNSGHSITTIGGATSGSLGMSQGKHNRDSIVPIQADPPTSSDFDSAIGMGACSQLTRSSRASQSSIGEFSDNYL